MLPSNNRLNLSFKRNNNGSKSNKISNQEFALLLKKRADFFKLTIVVTKKIAPKAVDRNRIKRIFRETFRAQEGIKGEYVVYVKENIAAQKAQDIIGKLGKILKKLNEKDS